MNILSLINRLIYDYSSMSGGSTENGGAKQDRTADLLRARQALSQLSYSPILYPQRESGGSGWTRTTDLTLIRGAL